MYVYIVTGLPNVIYHSRSYKMRSNAIYACVPRSPGFIFCHSSPLTLQSSYSTPACARIIRESSALARTSKYVSLILGGAIDVNRIKSEMEQNWATASCQLWMRPDVSTAEARVNEGEFSDSDSSGKSDSVHVSL